MVLLITMPTPKNSSTWCTEISYIYGGVFFFSFCFSSPPSCGGAAIQRRDDWGVLRFLLLQHELGGRHLGVHLPSLVVVLR